MKTTFNLNSFINFLGRNKLYTAINIFGFSVSLMFVILIAAYTTREFSVDQFHAKKERIFRLGSKERTNNHYQIGQDLKTRYPEIESYCFVDMQQEILTYRDQKVDAKTLLADSSFFRIFSFDLIEGEPDGVFPTRTSAVINEHFAKTLFAEESPIGKEIVMYDTTLTITGVVADFHHSTLINPELIVNIKLLPPRMFKPYDACALTCFLLAKENTDLPSKADDMLTYFKEFYWVYQNGIFDGVVLTPITAVYFNPVNSGQACHTSNLTFIWILFSVGVLILIFAVINYINLSVAQGGFRAKEMAVRMLVGGTRFKLILHMVLESVLLCGFSFLLGGLFAFAGEETFNRTLETSIALKTLLTPEVLAGCVAFVGLLGLISGMIPALVITNVKPIDVMKGTLHKQTRIVYSKVLIAFQYFITILLIACTITMILQVRFMTRSDLGYRTKNILEINNALPDRSKADVFRDELMRIPGIERVAFASLTPTSGGNNNTDTQSNPDHAIGYQCFAGDSAYLKLCGFTVIKDNHNAAQNAIWLNETAIRELGLTSDSLSFMLFKQPRPIAGVVKDFYYQALTQSISPCQIQCITGDWHPWRFLVQLAEGSDPAQMLQVIKATYERMSEGIPFSGRFSDEIVQGWYSEQQRMFHILGYLALLAVVIATLGILAMSTYFVRQRSLEIAVRKVYGSTCGEVLKRLLSHFLRLVVVGFVVAVPVVWYVMQQWLENYTLRISLSWVIFAVAGAVAFTLAFVTVFWQSYRAANANPVKTIKK